MRSWTLIIILWIIHIVQCQQSDEGVILNGPQTQIVSPGETVAFNCHARGYSNGVYWYINGRDPYPQSDFEARGFTFTYSHTELPDNQLREYNNTITVEARLSNNGTRISCTAMGRIFGQHDFQEGTLIIAGPPSRPMITNFVQQLVINSSNFTYHLYWSAPFTWPQFPITSYNVTVFDDLTNDSTPTIMPVNDSHSQNLSFDGITYGESCYLITFYVSAMNQLGEGEHTMMQSGHHIIPSEIGDIETTVTFLSNGTPHLWMSFLAPKICPGYQTGSYSITITDNHGSPTHAFEPQDYTQEIESERTLIVKEIKSGLNLGDHYEIEVTAMSMGIARSRRKAFNTTIDALIVCISPSSIYDTTITSKSLSNATDACLQPGLVIGITVGVTTFLTSCSLCLLLLLCLAYRQRKSNRKLSRMPVLETDSALTIKNRKPKPTKPPNLVLQAKNPIYEGAMYETTPGESLKSLLSPCSVPCTPVAEAATRYTFDFPQAPRLPPPRKGSVSIPPKLETHEEVKDTFKPADLPPLHLVGDEYMTMNAAESNKWGNLSEAQGNSKDDTYSTVGKCGEDEYVTFKQ